MCQEFVVCAYHSFWVYAYSLFTNWTNWGLKFRCCFFTVLFIVPWCRSWIGCWCWPWIRFDISSYQYPLRGWCVWIIGIRRWSFQHFSKFMMMLPMQVFYHSWIDGDCFMPYFWGIFNDIIDNNRKRIFSNISFSFP